MADSALKAEVMTDHIISIANDFTRYPGVRYRKDGSFSGQEFRENVLTPALEDARSDNSVVVVILDGVAGYGSSFLEEAFGGLIRDNFTGDFLSSHLRIEANTPRFQHHRLRAQSYIVDAAKRSGQVHTATGTRAY
jgi:hypothetical protein